MLAAFADGSNNGDSALDPKYFDACYAKLRLKPSHVTVDLVRLDSDTITLSGGAAGTDDAHSRLGWDGKIDLDLLPIPTSSRSVFDDVLKQFVGVSVRGTVGEPVVKTFPLSN